jgi:hypothetical protein
MIARTRLSGLAAVIAASILPASAGAAEPLGSSAATAECRCRARGALFSMGEEICIGGQMAVCAMDQNVTTWRRTGRTCPAAGRSVTPRPIHAQWKGRRDG